VNYLFIQVYISKIELRPMVQYQQSLSILTPHRASIAQIRDRFSLFCLFYCRIVFITAVSINSFVYSICSHTTGGGQGNLSVTPKPWKKTLLNPNSTTPSCSFIFADISIKPSSILTSFLSGVSPARKIIRSEVCLRTSK